MREIAVRFKPGDFKLQVEEVTLHQSKITSSLILLYYWKQRSKSHSYRTTKNQDSRLLIKNLIFILSFASPKNCFLENTTVSFIHPPPPHFCTPTFP